MERTRASRLQRGEQQFDVDMDDPAVDSDEGPAEFAPHPQAGRGGRGRASRGRGRGSRGRGRGELPDCKKIIQDDPLSTCVAVL